MARSEFDKMIEESVKNAVNSLFEDNESEWFWDKFDEAVAQTFQNGAYGFGLMAERDGLAIYLQMGGMDGPQCSFSEAFDSWAKLFPCFDDELRQQTQQAIIDDLERALKIVKAWGA